VAERLVGRDGIERPTPGFSILNALESGTFLAHTTSARRSFLLPDDGVESHETANLALVGRVMAEAALRREESRGAHYRIDFPESRRHWRRRQLFVVRRRPMLQVHAIGEAGWADVEVLS